MSQMQLADLLGVSFQQVQKYERGSNRIASSRLFQLSQILDMPVSYFFEDIPTTVSAGTKSDATIAEQPGDFENLFMRETLELVRAYYRIKDANIRRRFRSLVSEVGSNG
jgi:transcriptional regulator with XRE-family HTH domain